MKPTAILKAVDIRAVNSITRASFSSSTLRDTFPSSRDTNISFTLTTKRGKEVNIASRLCDKNNTGEDSIRPSIRMAPPVLAQVFGDEHPQILRALVLVTIPISAHLLLNSIGSAA